MKNGENLISRVVLLLDSNVWFLMKKITRHTKGGGGVWPAMRKKELMEIVPGKDFDDISTKDFKTTNAQRTKEEFGESQENDVWTKQKYQQRHRRPGWGGEERKKFWT